MAKVWLLSETIKLISRKSSKGLSSHIGLITLFDPDTGIPKGIVNADMITAIRTAAASAVVATEKLANDTSKTMAIIVLENRPNII